MGRLEKAHLGSIENECDKYYSMLPKLDIFSRPSVLSLQWLACKPMHVDEFCLDRGTLIYIKGRNRNKYPTNLLFQDTHDST